MIHDDEVCRKVPEIRAASPIRSDDVDTSGIITAGLSISYEYTNYTKHDLYLKTQANVPFVIEPNRVSAQQGDRQPHLEIKTIYHIKANGSFVKTKELLDSISLAGEHMSEETKRLDTHIRETLRLNSRVNSHNNFKSFSSIRVLEDEFDECGSVYVRSTDVLVTKNRDAVNKPHPNSNEGFQQVRLETEKRFTGHSGVFIYIVDNERRVPSYFFYSARQIIEVPSMYDPKQETGVYIMKTEVKGSGLNILSEFKSFEEAMEIYGLYTTRDEARTNGDPSILLKKEERERIEAFKKTELESSERVRRMEHENELLKNENAKVKDMLDIASRRRAHEFEEISHRRKLDSLQADQYYTQEERQSKTKMEKTKHKMEKKTAGMKFANEAIKLVPALILGAVGIYAATRPRSGLSDFDDSYQYHRAEEEPMMIY